MEGEGPGKMAAGQEVEKRGPGSKVSTQEVKDMEGKGSELGGTPSSLAYGGGATQKTWR